MIICPTKTIAGRKATFNANNTGISFNLTHASIGEGGGPIDDTRTALRKERERVPVYGQRVNDDQLHLDGTFDGPGAFWVRELGLWDGPTLMYYWSSQDVDMGHKGQNFEWLLGLDLALDPTVDGVINVTALPPSTTQSNVPYLATALKSLSDTNRLILRHHYL